MRLLLLLSLYKFVFVFDAGCRGSFATRSSYLYSKDYPLAGWGSRFLQLVLLRIVHGAYIFLWRGIGLGCLIYMIAKAEARCWVICCLCWLENTSERNYLCVVFHGICLLGDGNFVNN